jgi:hypothetical protein
VAPHREKPRITSLAVARDGHLFDRSLMEDFETLPTRWTGPVVDAMNEEDAEGVMHPGVWAYDVADYETALGWFLKTLEIAPQLDSLLHTHIAFCRRVIETELDDEDLLWTSRKRPGRLRQRLWAREVPKARCKWCGHYTTYFNPEWGLGWLGENTCSRCGWNFPMSAFYWDCPDGLAYSYYRGSFTGSAFYDWFETVFDVSPRRDQPQARARAHPTSVERDRLRERCPDCGKLVVGASGLEQHRRAKHGPSAAA